MRITTWNVNSIRSRLDLVLDFIQHEAPDVLALQETRCSDAQFPFSAFAEVGFDGAHHGAGGHGGVALLSRIGLERVNWGFGGEHGPPFDEPRLISADIGNLRVSNLYAPNGRQVGAAAWEFKLAWFELLRTELELDLRDHAEVVVLGDFNVCPADIDVYDPVKKRNRNLVSEPERDRVRALIDLGLTDAARHLHPDESGFTWFSHGAGQFENGRGYRLDLALISDALLDRATSCRPQLDWRAPDLRPSDHAPVSLEISDRR